MLAPEMEADGICQRCRIRPGTLMLDVAASTAQGWPVPVILCRDCDQGKEDM
jgi:hypothetical protein